jgi:GNAT superfamily N-acetyltransferase
MVRLVRTDSNNPDFIALVKELDAYLKITDGDEHSFYNQFNAITSLQHAVVAYKNLQPFACGAFKAFNKNSVEIKRMYTLPNARGEGLASMVLNELENWALELNYNSTVLETGVRQTEAIQFYKKNLYTRIPNYGQYIGIKNSRCFKKKLSDEER